VAASTAEPEAPAIYARGLPRTIQEIELACLDEGIELPPANRGRTRRFCQDLGFVVGASKGEETTWVYVEWAIAGDVHGRPITLEELRRTKGFRP
jgi:hypothetical protein